MAIVQIILVLFVVTCGVFPAFAGKLDITLYPSGADVLESRDVVIENGLITLDFPLDMQDESLRLAVEGGVVRDLAVSTVWRPMASRMAETRQRWMQEKARLAELESRYAALSARFSLWNKPPGAFSSVDELARVEETMQQRITELQTAMRTLSDEKHARQRSVALLEEQLRRMARVSGSAADSGKALDFTVDAVSAKQAAVRVAPAEGGQPLSGTLKVSVSYRLDNCGWQPRYVLEASTEQKSVLVRREATVTQRTGQDWNAATLRLGTAAPSADNTPRPVQPWYITPMRPMPRAVGMSASPSMKMESNDAMAGLSGMTSMPDAPELQENAVSAAWDLGAYSVLSGEPLQLALDAQTWEADFYRLLRPTQAPTAWLMATVTPPAPQVFATAPAALYVDSLYVGTAPFSFSGVKDDIAFGEDQAVTVTMQQERNQSGDKGFISRSSTRDWVWIIKARNAHAFPVDVRIEDAAPQSGDEKIVVRVNSQPAPQREEHVLRWELTLQPGAESVIRHAVNFTAPQDMSVYPGR